MSAAGHRSGRRLLIALGVAVLLVLTGCSAAGQDRPGVVVTTNILGDITRRIVGGEAEVTVLMKPDADPHSFGISAQEAAKLEQAGLVVHNGLGLEEGIARNVQAAESAGIPAVAVGERVDPLGYTAAGAGGQLDPHFWTDPRRVSRAVDVIAEQVIAHVDGVDPQVVRANAAQYREAVDRLDAEMAQRFAGIPAERRKLVTNHHVFGYLAQRYGFEVIGAVVPSGTTLASPSASDLKSLADTIRAAGVPAIFADSSQPDRLAQVLADQVGLRVEVVPLFSESLSRPGRGAGDYLEMMRSNTESIVRGLGRS
ncbi:zinc/manganese transport system substrate-binding protein [Saccharopolyspora kobensis]|uniref:Zinc/manganese transport system substrate-binding protein n=1 Tax=Saccharopolyspora kobensis TaxID=146035 RepID=A0A1H6AKC0_9PSEU|nr:zinc ABC transporter substrate-binding protein AztC [Saccharopolyspora kobensis]SEG48475.1 zinc/manganese transport system substrate-binding protein [Saccharopolyspora kobensis]SFE57845.1 zinc/manganese transport system substrate-binding protein [Saccharopolyspora kobensis]